MGIQIIHHQPDFWRVRIVDLQQFSNLISPVNSSPSLASGRMPPARQWLRKQKNAAGSVSNVFSVLPLWVSRLHWNWRSGFVQQLIRLLIHTDDGKRLFEGLLIQIQNILHTSHKCSILFRGNAPAFTKMRLEFVFLKGTLPTHVRCYRCIATPPIYQPGVAASIWLDPLAERYNREL